MGQGQVGNVHVVVVELVQVHDAAGGRDQVLVGQDNSLKTNNFTYFFMNLIKNYMVNVILFANHD